MPCDGPTNRDTLRPCARIPDRWWRGSEGRNPIEDLQNLRREIDLYDPALSSRDWFVVANKMDLPVAKKNLKALQKRFPKLQILPASAANGEGIEALKQALATGIPDLQEIT